MYLPVPGFEPTSSEFLDKCICMQSTKDYSFRGRQGVSYIFLLYVQPLKIF